jgi:hypothetical protein
MNKTLVITLLLALGSSSLSLAETGVCLAAKGAQAVPAPAVSALKVVAAPGTASHQPPSSPTIES